MRSHSSPRKNSHLTISTKPIMSGLYVHFCACPVHGKPVLIFHVVNLQRNRTWFPENFHK
ncbi:hypothetical protein C6086_26055 [Escherichia coli]|nr:hypothetical protein C6086_26055 [Escherichia coli]